MNTQLTSLIQDVKHVFDFNLFCDIFTYKLQLLNSLLTFFVCRYVSYKYPQYYMKNIEFVVILPGFFRSENFFFQSKGNM